MNSKGWILLKEARNSGTLWGQTDHFYHATGEDILAA